MRVLVASAQTAAATAAEVGSLKFAFEVRVLVTELQTSAAVKLLVPLEEIKASILSLSSLPTEPVSPICVRAYSQMASGSVMLRVEYAQTLAAEILFNALREACDALVFISAPSEEEAV